MCWASYHKLIFISGSLDYELFLRFIDRKREFTKVVFMVSWTIASSSMANCLIIHSLITNSLITDILLSDGIEFPIKLFSIN